jgi:hypothetical protein
MNSAAKDPPGLTPSSPSCLYVNTRQLSIYIAPRPKQQHHQKPLASPPFNMECEQSPANASELEEIPHISTLSLAQLEASIARQEAYSRKALGNAFAGRQEAERHREAAIQCDADAQASRVRYEEAEHVINELRKAIVDKNRHMLEGHLEPGRIQISNKRQHVGDLPKCKRNHLRLELMIIISPQAQDQTFRGSD